jgi:hypothetical protein
LDVWIGLLELIEQIGFVMDEIMIGIGQSLLTEHKQFLLILHIVRDTILPLILAEAGDILEKPSPTIADMFAIESNSFASTPGVLACEESNKASGDEERGMDKALGRGLHMSVGITQLAMGVPIESSVRNRMCDWEG